MAKSLPRSILGLLTTALLASAHNGGSFDVHVAELNGIRMISTSDFNYGITNPNFAQNWRTVSVNDDDVIIVTRDNQIYTKALWEMSDLERAELKRTKSELSKYMNFGSGGGSSFSSINFNNNQQAKYSTFSSSGSQISSSSSVGGDNQMGHYTLNDLSFSMNNDDFAVYRKDNMPFDWSRVFVNGDLLTTVLNNGNVYMKPIASATPDERKQLELLKAEVKALANQQQQQFSNTMQNSMNVMQNIMGNLFRQFTPDSGSPLGNGFGGIFGNSFPFGPNNSPFANGFPFGSTGAFAGAFAGRR